MFLFLHIRALSRRAGGVFIKQDTLLHEKRVSCIMENKSNIENENKKIKLDKNMNNEENKIVKKMKYMMSFGDYTIQYDFCLN